MDGRVLNFRLTGINNQNFIMEDRETGSWWQQVTGRAIHGPLKGKQLPLVFHDELAFRTWTAESPGGRVLRPAVDSGWIRFSDRWEERTARAPVRVAAALDPRLEPRTVVIGLEVNGASKAYPLTQVLSQYPLHDRLGGVPIVLVAAPDGKSVRAFEARLDGQPIELFRRSDGASAALRDVGTGSQWDFRGHAVAGPLQGRRLVPLYVLRDYWFDWKTYHPETGVYRLGAHSF